MRPSARVAPALAGLAFLVVVAACSKKRDASDISGMCNHVKLRLAGWSGRLDDPQLDCPRLASIAHEAVAFTKAMHETALKDGQPSESLSLAVDLEASTAAWAAEVDKCHTTSDDWSKRNAIIKATADKVRTAIANDRERVQGRCGGR
jgi:hypothetical protein